MTTETITEYTLRQECESCAKYIIAEYDGDLSDIDALREYCENRASEVADSHPLVIYTYKAKQVAAIAPDDAEQWLEDIYGKPFDGCETYDDVVTRLAFAAMYTGIREELAQKLEEIESECPTNE